MRKILEFPAAQRFLDIADAVLIAGSTVEGEELFRKSLFAEVMHREDPVGVGIVHEILDALPPALEARVEGDEGGREMLSADALELFVVDVRELLILHIAVPPPVVEVAGMVDAEAAELDDERDAFIIRAECLDGNVDDRCVGVHRISIQCIGTQCTVVRRIVVRRIVVRRIGRRHRHSCPPACELDETVLVWKHWTGERLDGRRYRDVVREHEEGARVAVVQCENLLRKVIRVRVAVEKQQRLRRIERRQRDLAAVVVEQQIALRCFDQKAGMLDIGDDIIHELSPSFIVMLRLSIK